MMADDPFPSSEDDTLDRLPQKWASKGVMPTCPVAGSFKFLKTEEISFKIEEIRDRFNIPGSVDITLHDGLQHPVESDEVVASFYHLEYGLLMPIDAEMCEILIGWGISLQHLHPSIIISIRRLLTISRVFCRRLLPSDVHRIISHTPCVWDKGAELCFICTWIDSERRLYEFPGMNQTRKSGRVPPDFESEERIRKLFDLPDDLFNVSYPDSIVQLIYNREKNLGRISAAIPAVPVTQYHAPPSSGQSAQERANSKERHSSLSSSSGFPRIPRKRNCPTVGRNEAQISTPRTNDIRGLRRLRKTHQDYRPHRVNRDAEPLKRNVTHIPDAMSEKVCVVARHCQRLFHKNYNFVEESVCASSGAFVPGLAENRENINSGSSDEDLGVEPEIFEDISSGGPPSPFLNLNAARIPLGRESIEEMTFPIPFIYDSSPSNDNISASVMIFYHQVIQPPFPTEYLLDCNLFSACGLMGSGSTNPCPENENVTRPASIPQSDTGISRPVPASLSLFQPINESDCGTLLKTMTAHYDQ
ncbi:hypothetical protein MKW92_038174, partial [Papaver armeniacum]